MSDLAWQRTIFELEVVLAEIRAELTLAALERLKLPDDVAKRPQHPLTVAVRELVGSGKQLLQGRELAGTERPEWFALLEEAYADALEDLAAELKTLSAATAT